jgi:hypothetical protein
MHGTVWAIIHVFEYPEEERLPYCQYLTNSGGFGPYELGDVSTSLESICVQLVLTSTIKDGRRKQE